MLHRRVFELCCSAYCLTRREPDRARCIGCDGRSIRWGVGDDDDALRTAAAGSALPSATSSATAIETTTAARSGGIVAAATAAARTMRGVPFGAIAAIAAGTATVPPIAAAIGVDAAGTARLVRGAGCAAIGTATAAAGAKATSASTTSTPVAGRPGCTTAAARIRLVDSGIAATAATMLDRADTARGRTTGPWRDRAVALAALCADRAGAERIAAKTGVAAIIAELAGILGAAGPDRDHDAAAKARQIAGAGIGAAARASSIGRRRTGRARATTAADRLDPVGVRPVGRHRPAGAGQQKDPRHSTRLPGHAVSCATRRPDGWVSSAGSALHVAMT